MNWLDAMLASAPKKPPLTAKEERALALKAQAGSKWAAEVLTQRNIRLIVDLVRPYSAGGVGLEDLVQEGWLGFSVAIQKYDPSRGELLRTYARWWVKAYAQAYSRRQASGGMHKGRSERNPEFVGTEAAEAFADQSPTPEAAYLAAEAQREATKAIASACVGLTDIERLVMKANVIDGQSYGQVAPMIGRSREVVRRKSEKGKKQIEAAVRQDRKARRLFG